MRKIGAITIGQAPRDDLVPELEAVLGSRAEIIQRGALDDLNLPQVLALSPGAADSVLVTRMRDGTEVKISERHIVGRLGRCISDLEREEVDLMVLLCTGEFPTLQSRILLIRLDRLLEGVVRGLLSSGRLAAVAPSSDQIPMVSRRWARVCPTASPEDASRVAVEAVSPYTGTEAELEAAARRVKECEPALVVLDCIGFTEKARGVFRRITGRPVILPRTLLGRVAGELIA
jgi:protein AroM